MKRALRLVDVKANRKRADYVGDEVEPSAPWVMDVDEAAGSSDLLRICLGQDDTADAYACRFARCVTRGPVEMRASEWVIVVDEHGSVVGKVGEIVELAMKESGACIVRMLLREARAVQFEDPTKACVIEVDVASACGDHYVCLERASVHEVACYPSEDGTGLCFNYLY